MIISFEQLQKLQDDPSTVIIEVIKSVKGSIEESNDWSDEEYAAMLEAYALTNEICDSKLIEIPHPNFDICGHRATDCQRINDYLTTLEVHCKAERSNSIVSSLRKHFRTAINTKFSYEFSQGDLDKVQNLINQVRELISKSKDLEEDHKRRLLSRLEKLQSELHKKVSDLDRFWGLIGDAGVMLGKLGSDAKPIVDCIKEIADIVWQTQSRAEELPSGTEIPLLTSNTEECVN